MENKNKPQSETEKIIGLWLEDGGDYKYYEAAEKPEWLDGFWNSESLFRKSFSKLNTDYTLEIACGTGRHSFQIVNNTKHLWLLDTSKDALELARKKFKANKNVTFVHSQTGYGIPTEIKDNSLTAVFSYDAMVHFEYDAVISYLKDSFRVLKDGGKVLFHHSNYDKNPGGVISDNPSWRNFMSQALFIHIAKRAGFRVLESNVILWADVGAIDCLTLLQK